MGSLKLTESSQPLKSSGSKSDANRPSDHMPCAMARENPKARAERSLMWMGLTSPEMNPYRRPRPAGAGKLLDFTATPSGVPSARDTGLVVPADGFARARKVQVSSQSGS